VQKQREISRGEAIRWLAQRAGLSERAPTPEERKRWAKEARARARKQRRIQRAQERYDRDCARLLALWSEADGLIDEESAHMKRMAERADLPPELLERAQDQSWAILAQALHERERLELALEALRAP